MILEMFMYTAMAERNEKGHFAESPDSLHSKTIGLRLHKTHYPKFLEAAQSAGKSPTELAREVIEQWLDDQEEVSGN